MLYLQMGRIKGVFNVLYPWYQDRYVEVKGPLGWGQLCIEALSVPAANVICRENHGLFVFKVRPGLKRPNYDGVKYTGVLQCAGHEMSLDECTVSFEVTTECSGGSDAVLECTDSKNI